LEHHERVKWCSEISRINKQVNAEKTETPLI